MAESQRERAQQIASCIAAIFQEKPPPVTYALAAMRLQERMSERGVALTLRESAQQIAAWQCRKR